MLGQLMAKETNPLYQFELKYVPLPFFNLEEFP